MSTNNSISTFSPESLILRLEGSLFPTLAVLLLALVAGILYLNISPGDGSNEVKKIPIVTRPRLLDAYRSGVWWRIFLPRLVPYIQEGYYKYSKHDRPFRIWISGFQDYTCILPERYLEQIKNMPVTEVSFSAFVNKYFSVGLPTGEINNLIVQVVSKLLNGNLATIRPLIQGETRKALAREIGSPTEWKRLNAFDITRKTASAPGARIIFGESLAGDERFIAGVSQYVAALNVYAFALRYASVGPFKNIILYLLHWGHRRSFPAILTPLSRVIAERKQAQSGQNLSEDEKPFDCIQWAMDQEIPDKKKSPEDIATRLVIVATGAIDTIAGVLTKVLVELACHPECLDEVRAEIRECLAEEDGDWTVKAMGKMGKLESLLQESLRVTAGAIAFSGLRLVTNSGFRLDDQTILPNNALLAFPSRCILHDADIFPEPDKFDVLRFYKVKESNAKGTEAHSAQRAVRAGWLQFGYGRQSCPGKLYAINLMKTLVGEMLLRYEIRLAGGSDGTRPAIDFDLDPMLPPNRSIYLEFKSIA